MINIFYLKPVSGNAADGIDNVNISVFSRFNPKTHIFWVDAPENFISKGAIKRLDLRLKIKKFRFFEKIVLIRKLKPSYIFGIGSLSEIIYVFFKPKKTRYVIDFHTVLLKNEKYWKVRMPWFLRKFIFSMADLIIAVSGFSAQSVRKHFPNKKVISILNGIDLELFSQNQRNKEFLNKKYGIDFSKPLVAFVGALHPRKRPDLFIKLAAKCPVCNFIMVGRKNTEYDFLSGAGHLPNFTWIESMPRQDVANLFASSRVFVFPSLNEASAAVILEAMACGCVPVISKSGGNGEFLTDGISGFLIEQDSDELDKFALKINELCSNDGYWKKISTEARKEAEKHSWDFAALKYQEVLSDN